MFSDIGGAEVALHKLGILLNVSVSVEILDVHENILKNWCDEIKLKGVFVRLDDAKKMDEDEIKKLIKR
ncbi:hypothetical protein KSP39_PZI014688 [Platanthera zijinensis]|uniref:SAM-dependent MTase DRM-type domain-containing protein n=1 Tax=Platanthera zijinensis TaxID=2320716 RepID=A0AAP0BBT8_9ASPA